MAESGELDSSVILIREKFEAMKETDPAKGDELLKDLEAPRSGAHAPGGEEEGKGSG